MWIEESSHHARENSATEGSGAKQLERLNVSSGYLLVIDQFMPSNKQFLSMLPEVDASDPDGWVRANAARIREAAEQYGGVLLELTAGSWGVLRDPNESLFILARIESDDEEHDLAQAKQAAMEARGNMAATGRVFVDTRCVIFVDARALADRVLLQEYGEMRSSGNDKGARDRIRECGAAVRYGFNRNGDELGVFKVDGVIALWPDVVE